MPERLNFSLRSDEFNRLLTAFAEVVFLLGMEKLFALLYFGHILFESVLFRGEESLGFVDQSDAGFQITDTFDLRHLLQKYFDLFKILFDNCDFKILKPLLLQRVSPLSMSQAVL